MKLDKRLIAASAHCVVLLTTAMTFAQKVDAPNTKTLNAPSSAASEQQPAPQSPAVDQGQGATNPTSPADPAPQTNVAGTNTAPASPPAAAPVAAAPQQAPTAVAPVQPLPDAKESKEAPTPALPSKLALGKDGWLQVGALLQGWFDTQWNSEIPPGASHGTKMTFRMRRAEVKLSGDIVKDAASFLVSFDPASTLKVNTTNYTVPNTTSGTQKIPSSTISGSTAALKLFWVTLKSPYVEASIGQFKYPIGYEGQSTSAELAFPERGYSSRYFGDTYDMGIRLEKKLDWFKYQVFLLNGSGQNQLDTNLQKDLAARLEFTPIDGITVGTAGLTSLGQRTKQTTTKDTVELFGRLTKEGFLVQGELLWGESGRTASGVERTKAAGRYAIVGYTIADKIQPVVRYGYLNTDKTTTVNDKTSYALNTPFGVATDEVRSYEIGLNYFVQGHNYKLQAAYGYYDFDNIPALQELTVVGQAAF